MQDAPSKEIDEDGEELDPREELVQQLLEYKMYKYMSYELRERMREVVQTFFKKPTIPKEVSAYKAPVDTSGLLDDLTLQKLHAIFQDILKRQEDKLDPIRSKFGQNRTGGSQLPEKLDYVEQYALKHKKVYFSLIIS